MPAKNKHVQEDAVKSGEASTKLPQGGAPTGGDIDNEALVRAITDRVLAELSKR